VQWIGWHLGELACLAVPTVLAVTVWPWFALLTVLVAASWTAHEVRLHRHRRRALTAGRRRPVLTAVPDQNTTTSRGGGQASA
jgi:hypothetical protein